LFTLAAVLIDFFPLGFDPAEGCLVTVVAVGLDDEADELGCRAGFV